MKSQDLGVVAIGVLFFICGFQVRNAVLMSPDKVGDLATWVGAFGTILAFAGTVYIAMAQTRQKELEAYNLAVLTSARLLPKLRAFVSFAEAIRTTILNHKVSAQGCETWAMSVQNQIGWAPSDLMPIIGLPNNAAYKLEYVSSMLPIFFEELRIALAEAVIEYDLVGDRVNLDTARVELAVDAYIVQLTGAIEDVKSVIAECKKISPCLPLRPVLA